MINNLLTDKDDNPVCPQCGYTIKPWGKAKCDVCDRAFCKHHRPMFDFSGKNPKYVAFWVCDECKEKLVSNPR